MKSYIKNNPELIEKFSNAINKGLKYVKENNANDIAKKIESFFPDTSLEDLTIMIDRYKNFYMRSNHNSWNFEKIGGAL